ncbi:class I SAM-dependent methyltransferase [Actinophytocola sediminis]
MVRLARDDELVSSWVVANRDMNRGRGLAGRDGYVRVLGVDLLSVLTERLAAEPQTTVRWLDLCCGRGTALVHAAEKLRQRGVLGQVRIIGVDLVDGFVANPPPQVRFVTASVAAWQPAECFDLITCVHGLHYVGDKLGVLAAAASWLTATGQFVANFDATSIRLPDGTPVGRRLTTALRAVDFVHNPRARRIHRRGPARIRLPFQYLGANDRAGPNYTGQPAVHSYYEPDPR